MHRPEPTDDGVERYLAAKASDEQRADCRLLMAVLEKVTLQPPRMWGAGIVGHGTYQYTYETGRKGTSCLAGFAVRGREIVIYLAPYWDGAPELLGRLGKHRMGKGCVYFRRIADLDPQALEALIAGSVAELRRRYPAKAGA